MTTTTKKIARTLILSVGIGIVENCEVAQVTGSGTVSGIAAGTVRGCRVASVNGPGSSSVYGIRGATVAECTVSEVHSNGNGVSTGIQGGTVTACSVGVFCTQPPLRSCRASGDVRSARSSRAVLVTTAVDRGTSEAARAAREWA